ncbi:hypothetical protein GS597_10690 [Synechococcales cyanobacterium C]|uniref:DUF2203 domain-containing protein n=1 Tax=Petrachloros mirabilis ULC683 TaxID=2781853 RepID=A0A8K2A7J2_9CYAN|nr:hypothetical protein [Petrachloros mirabilis]NCJ06966.1 hypothetical protein [Petrachloros mirabilis ULC683]
MDLSEQSGLGERQSNPEAPSPTGTHPDIEAAIAEAETTLNTVKSRYLHLESAQAQKTQLQEQLTKLRQEIEQLQNHLELVEIELESRLITWKDRREWFWQFLRYAGIGFVAALILHAIRN